MPYQPKSESEIFQSLLARVVAQSKLTDVIPGSPLTHILGTTSKEIYKLEYRLKAIRDSFNFLNASGTDLDDRLSDFPPAGIARLPAKHANGDSIRLIIDFKAGTDISIPAGTRYGRSDNSDLEYIQVNDVSIPGNFQGTDGTIYYPTTANASGIRVVCSAPGPEGNAGIGVVDKLNGPISNVLGAENVYPISGGALAESDDLLKERASLYIASLSRITASALAYIGKSFISTPETDGQPVESFRHVRVYESSFVPGYTEILVDTGSGGFTLQGSKSASSYTTAGKTRYYTWPHMTMHPPILYHDAPAVDPLTHHDVYLLWAYEEAKDDTGVAIPGTTTQKWYRMSSTVVKDYYGIPLDVDPVLSIPERGLLYLDPTYAISASPLSVGENSAVAIAIGRPDLDNIQNTELPVNVDASEQYLVFTGAIAEFQAIIEGDPNDPIKFPGYRPAGCRVRVTLPFVQLMSKIDASVEIEVGYDLETKRSEIQDLIAFYVEDLAPGQPFLKSKLIAQIMAETGVLNFTINTPTNDFYPNKETYSLRINAENITVN